MCLTIFNAPAGHDANDIGPWIDREALFPIMVANPQSRPCWSASARNAAMA
jgi:hypothetical protein